MYVPSASLDKLNADLALIIFGFLSPCDLTAAAAVSRQCQQFAQDDFLWRRFTAAPPGRARRHHLREIAWRTARAVYGSPVTIHAPVRSVQVLPTSIALTALTRSATDSTELAIRPISWDPPVSILHVPLNTQKTIALATGYEAERGRRLAASVHYIEGAVSSDCEVSIYAATDTECAQGIRPHRVFCARRTGATTVAVGATSVMGVTVLVGTRTGATFIGRGDNRLHVLDICSEAVRAVSFANHTSALVGTVGGQVVQVDMETGIKIGDYVGPCSCPISALSASENNIVVAGVAHCVAGNGHSSLAVAWDMRTRSRLAAIGRGSFLGRSSAVSPAPVTAVRAGGSGKRIGLLVAGEVFVHDVTSWRCLVRASFGNDALSMDLDDDRLAVLCQPDEISGSLHVLDFAKAIDKMPKDVRSFEPEDGRSRDWRHIT